MKTVVVSAQQKWEASSVTAFSESSVVDALNRAGQEGWEPFAAFYYKDMKGSNCWTVFVKRPSSGQVVKASAGEAGAPEATQPAAKTQPKTPEPAGFDLDGDIFEIKKE